MYSSGASPPVTGVQAPRGCRVLAISARETLVFFASFLFRVFSGVRESRSLVWVRRSLAKVVPAGGGDFFASGRKIALRRLDGITV